MDVLTPSQRHRNMAAIRGQNTRPEVAVRSILHRLGYRFRLHPTSLLGKPDIVLPRYRTVVFVNGCFWHRHRGCRYASTPQTRITFWKSKFLKNQARDRAVYRALRGDGWTVLVVWECELRHADKLSRRLQSLLSVKSF